MLLLRLPVRTAFPVGRHDMRSGLLNNPINDQSVADDVNFLVTTGVRFEPRRGIK